MSGRKQIKDLRPLLRKALPQVQVNTKTIASGTKGHTILNFLIIKLKQQEGHRMLEQPILAHKIVLENLSSSTENICSGESYSLS